jgi:hypothetical protein
MLSSYFGFLFFGSVSCSVRLLGEEFWLDPWGVSDVLGSAEKMILNF